MLTLNYQNIYKNRVLKTFQKLAQPQDKKLEIKNMLGTSPYWLDRPNDLFLL